MAGVGLGLVPLKALAANPAVFYIPVNERERGYTMLLTGRYPRCRAIGLLAVLTLLVGTAPGHVKNPGSQGSDKPVVIPAEVEIIATGIPGAGAICQVGTFHLGGPFPGRPAVQPGANVVSRRSAMTLRGTSLIDTIRDERILAVMVAQPETVRSRPHYMPDGRATTITEAIVAHGGQAAAAVAAFEALADMDKAAFLEFLDGI
jgi:di-heme oxidoreductase (putative peroxidase)